MTSQEVRKPVAFERGTSSSLPFRDPWTVSQTDVGVHRNEEENWHG